MSTLAHNGILWSNTVRDDTAQTSMMHASDEDVLTASFSNPDEFIVLVRRYEAPFLRKALQVVSTREDAEDVVQETFTKIYLHGPKFEPKPGASFRSWGYKILMNTAFTHYGKLQRKRQHTADLSPELYELLPDKHDEFERLETTEYVVGMLARLPDQCARVLAKHFLEDKPHAEIAREEGTTEGAIKTRVHRAKLQFRELAESLQRNP